MEWIKTSERLPDNGTENIVFFLDGVFDFGYYRARRFVSYERDWLDGSEYKYLSKVTHWMKLEEPKN